MGVVGIGRAVAAAGALVLLLGACGRGDDGGREVAAVGSFGAGEARSTGEEGAGCPAPTLEPGDNPTGDFVDFVKLGETTFVNQSPRRPVVAEAMLGEQIAVVCQSYRTRVADRGAVDRDAAFLDEGSPIYAVVGYSPAFRVAARRDGEIVLFEADSAPDARVGRDLVDLTGVVVNGISVNSETDGRTALGRIDDRATIDQLVALVHEAPVDQGRTDHDGPRYFVEFELADGTTVNRSFWLDSGELSRGIMLPPAFADAIRSTVG